MIETIIITATVAACFLITLTVINHRVGQYLNPPLQDELEKLRKSYDETRAELLEVRSKLNEVFVQKGMR